MPRNPQGLYTLPLPPVVPGELIEADWANPTLDDIASALTGSLPRNGTAPMLAPLTLSNIPPSQPRHAVDVAYVQQFLAYATGMPVGAVFPFSGSAIPAGYLLCDGQAVSRTVYATLFATIGTIYGSGDGATTFNVPDMRDQFVRGRGDGRQIGSTQASAFGAHIHPINDPGHVHTQTAHDHTLTTQTHAHSVNDPGHVHSYESVGGSGTLGFGSGGYGLPITNTSSETTGITVQAAPALTGNTNSKQPAIASSTTGVEIGATGEAETRPQNIAMNYLIKAADDATATVAVTGITSSNTSLLSVDLSNPVVPQLVPHANVAFGMLQLDANGKASAAQLPAGVQSFLGTFDASGGQNPSQAFPSTTFLDGDTYLLSNGGTILVFDPNTNTQALTPVDIGWNLVYLQNQTQPVGWYYLEAPVVTAAIASQVAFAPSGTIGATNVQAAIEELDTETQAGLAALNSSKTSAGNAQPTTNGVADPGVSAAASRQDHVHPVDTSRAPASAATAAGTSFTPGGNIAAATVQGAIVELDNEKAPVASPALTGVPTAPTAAPGTNTTQVATTAFVQSAVQSAGTGQGFAAYASASQSITTGATQKLLFNTEEYAVGNCFTPATSVFQPSQAGFYQIDAMAASGMAADGTFTLTLFKNGVAATPAMVAYSITGFTPGVCISRVVHMNGTTDTLEVRARNTSNNSVAALASFSASLVKAD